MSQKEKPNLTAQQVISCLQSQTQALRGPTELSHPWPDTDASHSYSDHEQNSLSQPRQLSEGEEVFWQK